MLKLPGELYSSKGGEDAAKRAYQTAVETGSLVGNAASTVTKQKQAQLQAHDKIKALRDQFKTQS